VISLSRDLYLTTYNTLKRQTSMPLAGFEPAISASEWPQTHALDRAATGIGSSESNSYSYNYNLKIEMAFPLIKIIVGICKQINSLFF
jgi:hypothetical protein